MSQTTVNTTYFIAYTPRTGSTYLCELLTRTGVAGYPGEHFNHGNAPDNPDGDPIDDYAGYINDCFTRLCTDNGVFGSKLDMLPDFTRRLQGIPHLANHDLISAIRNLFPNPHFIWLTRRNKVRQAVSHWKAIQSGRWHSPDTPDQSEPDYNFDAINHLVNEIIMREAGMGEFFAESGIIPHVVIYEDFVQQPEDTIRAILAHCGITEIPDLDWETTRFEKIADALSEAWVQRYRQEKQADYWIPMW